MRMPNPAPELSYKRSNFVVSLALFFKRPITIEDVREINPVWGKNTHGVRMVFERLERHNYVVLTPGGYKLTEFGRDKAIEYASWRANFSRTTRKD